MTVSKLLEHKVFDMFYAFTCQPRIDFNILQHIVDAVSRRVENVLFVVTKSICLITLKFYRFDFPRANKIAESY